jgi:hypothetical protein
MREKQEESGWREMSIGVGEIETPKSRDLFFVSHVKRGHVTSGAVGRKIEMP